ncbi:MAG: peptidase S41 [Betaproteobacteria bacterium HGW-Betaproteobacteria-13]|jgi:carboxyl-terminal processing protease|uniref:Peptidase S41 n=1 Tax=Parazoarcus communis TaxID=41977 RepID=A0A2U8H2B7_9RHOO|nr:S41 family peptidase [Parazoarcus communis]AWI80127.1 peptidase S41 [Parazoarcus communis]PKO59250.1 MAG: peptidase S41 [Betaproteobacteria bacterium HGW-Betaproteobacteria-19]PKO81221.1 MAG: peptidase S41 [Betaproteobacteria bacterium HGW-Betaproteobacteria-13]
MPSSKLKQFGLVMTGVVAGVMISLNFSANADKTALAPLPVEELRAFADVFNAIKQGYVEPVDDKKLVTHAISGMLSGLDPHSAYLDAEAFKDLQVGTQGEFGGLGIEVGMEDGFVKVVSPIEDTPAFRAGVKAGDLIVKLDDTPVKGMSLNDAVKRMRGKPKTDITLTIMRKGEVRPVIVTLTREVIKVQSVKSKVVEPGYGYLRVAQFQENTASSVVTHLQKLAKDGELKGLVLDLRNDPGGLLHGAVGVAAAFLPVNTLVVSTDGRTEDAKREFRASSDDYLRGSRDDFLRALPKWARDVPMVVLVNGGSASASEIVAGALQDHKRAVIMGTQSFGKGSVQTILPLNNTTAIKLTTARYYTPSGRSIQAKGIEPDIVVEESTNGSAKRIREADLDGHLGNDRDPEAERKAREAQDAQGAAEDEAAQAARFEQAGKDDYQLGQAINLLKGLQIVQNKK